MSDGSELTLVTQRALARADLSECETLHLWTAKVHDLSPLRRAKRLAKVVLYQTSVTDLAPLAGLALRELHLYENPELRDPSPIGAIESLASLDLEVPRAVRFVRGSLRPLGARYPRRGWCLSAERPLPAHLVSLSPRLARPSSRTPDRGYLASRSSFAVSERDSPRFSGSARPG